MRTIPFYIVNALTLYRLIAVPVLLWLIFTNNMQLFAILLPISFSTDFVDGFIARRYKVSTVLGARFDSLADDMNVLCAIFGLFVFRFDFIRNHQFIIYALLALFALQNIMALVRYKKMSSFHTYLAKLAALMQGLFLIFAFLQATPSAVLFYFAVIITGIELIEEIILVLLLPQWQINVKGLYWVMKKKQDDIGDA